MIARRCAGKKARLTLPGACPPPRRIYDALTPYMYAGRETGTKKRKLFYFVGIYKIFRQI